jgi:hypothetical protein
LNIPLIDENAKLSNFAFNAIKYSDYILVGCSLNIIAMKQDIETSGLFCDIYTSASKIHAIVCLRDGLLVLGKFDGTLSVFGLS